MNRARLTYRIDPAGGADRRKPPEEKAGNVIPLYEEEFHVVQEPPKQAAPGGGSEPPEATEETKAAMEGTSPFSAWRDPLAIDPLANDYGAWQGPIDLEVRKVEQAIRESDRLERASDGGQPLPRGDREYRSRYEGPELSYTTHMRTGPPPTPWLKLSASIAGAALTGVVLGFFVLQMFTGGGSTDGVDRTNPIVDALTKASGKAGAVATSKTDSPAAVPVSAAVSGAGGSSLGLAAQSYTMLQSGSFSSEQAADTMAADLRKKGFAAVVEPADKFYVYVGMATDKNNALGLSSMLKQQKVDVYMKAYPMPSVTALKWSGSTDVWKNYLSATDQMMGTISALSLSHLEDKQPSALDQSTVNSLKSIHESWLAAAQALDKSAPAEAKNSLLKLANAMNSAKKSIDEYQKNPSAAMLWNAQYSLLQGTLAEKELLTAISAQ